ncbi:AraC family transcriptional regulator [Planomonospora parontospora subsp. parontospora]|uniref:AraC family transcriptional regulator n=2 Tax=Planomonospora parontospora TaxID=58119 RepID=A0AA37BC38_9ACTN|nr:helix-turn-helix domain-containing protein [Planomonospora parontospora]GGK49783.1 AraC family transcriptional regulator [Planomonospora parontospora]GII07189.1 AraC family transcriptional regulator [Planomonospora parontospora subsp. parontospora]
MPTFVSTAGTPAREQAALWRDVVSRAFGPLELRTDDREGFAGRIVGRTLGPVQVSDVRAPAHVVSRAARHGLRDGMEHYKLSLLLRGSGVVEQAGRHVEVGSGDLVLYDLARPIRFALQDHHLLALTIPRSVIPLPPARVAELAGTLLGSREGPGSLAVSFLSALAVHGGPADGPYGVHFGEALVNVVTGALCERLDGTPPPGGAHAEAYARIVDWIERNLHRPELSPAVIAQAHHVSVRQLHRIFQAAGGTVTAHVRARRLDHCRRELAAAGPRGEAVGEVAARWGFTDATSFSRAFRRAYGRAPRDWRDRRD